MKIFTLPLKAAKTATKGYGLLNVLESLHDNGAITGYVVDEERGILKVKLGKRRMDIAMLFNEIVEEISQLPMPNPGKRTKE